MAFTDKVINGSDIVLKVGGTIIACSTSHTIELTNAVREVACKGSGDFTAAQYGRFSWTVSTDALFNLGSSDVTYSDLMGYMLAKTTVAIDSYYEENPTNHLALTGNAVITSISQVAGDNENASYSVSMQGTGALTVTSTES